MFSIRTIPNIKSEVDGQRLGEMSIDGFTEQFACCSVGVSTNELDRVWKTELRKLVNGSAAIALAYDPRFAWVIYRDGERCFVQQVFSPDGDFRDHLASRTTVTEDGQCVSEWNTDVSAIALFIGT